jgi:hypothetical protein
VLSLTTLRDRLAPRHRASGLFLCHAPTPHVFDHFARLQRDTDGIVDWTLVMDDGHLNDPRGDEAYSHPGILMPQRFAAARAAGQIAGGFGMMDIAIMPRVLAAPHDLVWAMEYDVDYSGDWSTLFGRFTANRADVLTTTLRSVAEEPGWWHWDTCRAPAQVERSAWRRSFNPLMRLSRRFAEAYVAATRSGEWGTHYEFTIPTIACHLGWRMEDIAHVGSPLGRFGPPLYTAMPPDRPVRGESFVYRPARSAYFHQRPDDFPHKNRLYHPIKAV